jgi:trimethylamine--corrinoid protein Co-methyltransferase
MPLKTKLEVLSKEDIARVHDASLKILKETGIVIKSREALDIFKQHGVKVDRETVYFSEEMVERALEQCPATFRWRGRNDARSITIGDGFAVQPNGGPVDIQDLDKGRRPALLEDFVNIQKLCQASDLVNIVGSAPVDPHDVKPDEKHLYLMYEILKNTDKPAMGYCVNKLQAGQMLDMVEIAMGHENSLQDNYTVGVSVNPLSPLAYGPETLETMIVYAYRNQPIFILPCILAGVTGPISLFGTVVQQNAEILAGIVLIQLINPGNPVVYCPSSTAANMRSGSYITSPPEAFLINCANLQMALDLYKMPTRIMCGMTDSKSVDCQAGYETMQYLMMGMLSGAHIIHECLGVLDSIMCTSYEKFIIDEELLSRVMRISKGLDTSDDALSMDVIQDVGHSGGYLTHDNTFQHFRERWTPTVSDWNSYGKWKKNGSEDILVRANRKFKIILENCPDTMIDPALDRELKAFVSRTLHK